MRFHDVLDWEESVFRGLVATWRRLTFRGTTREGRESGVLLEDERACLSVLAQLVAGEAVRLRPARNAGGLRGFDLLLPERMDLGYGEDLDRLAYRVQIVILAGLQRLSLEHAPPTADTYDDGLTMLRLTRQVIDDATVEWPRFEEAHRQVMRRVLERRVTASPRLDGREAELEQARRDAIEGARPWEDEALCARLTGMRAVRRRTPPMPIWGEWFERPDEVPAQASQTGEPREGTEPTTEADAPPVEGLRLVDPLEGGENDPPPSAPFERAETLDNYQGGGRDLDGADELEAQLDALEQVELGDLFRTDQASGSLLKMDIDLAGDIGDSAPDASSGTGIPYDEWDARRRRYRPGWCTVYAPNAPIGDGRWAAEALHRHRPLVRRLRSLLEAHRAGLRPAPRQLDGEDIDLEAAIDETVSQRAGRGGDPRLYVRSEKHRRDFATLVLIDASMSTDSWVDDRRILDVAREATLVLGEVAEELGDRLQIHAFASETRNHCHVTKLYAGPDDWSTGKRRLGALVPRGYTRIGPALRHATHLLATTPAERRLLLLISDGKPTDFDRYEGRYGVADVRQALREAHECEIHTHALAVDEVARDYMPSLFGRSGFDILARPEQLVESLTTVYGRLTAQ